MCQALLLFRTLRRTLPVLAGLKSILCTYVLLQLLLRVIWSRLEQICLFIQSGTP